jgi:nucleoside-diphosphate-sugar epimerase
MRKKIILITGAAGEVGHALIKRLAESDAHRLVTLDLSPLPADLSSSAHIQGDILDKALLDQLVSEYEIDAIFHLAALLSTRAEFSPERAHRARLPSMACPIWRARNVTPR